MKPYPSTVFDFKVVKSLVIACFADVVVSLLKKLKNFKSPLNARRGRDLSLKKLLLKIQ
jgi:hypothetical protein